MKPGKWGWDGEKFYGYGVRMGRISPDRVGLGKFYGDGLWMGLFILLCHSLGH